MGGRAPLLMNLVSGERTYSKVLFVSRAGECNGYFVEIVFQGI